jgi:hypothetical protein
MKEIKDLKELVKSLAELVVFIAVSALFIDLAYNVLVPIFAPQYHVQYLPFLPALAFCMALRSLCAVIRPGRSGAKK